MRSERTIVIGLVTVLLSLGAVDVRAGTLVSMMHVMLAQTYCSDASSQTILEYSGQQTLL